MRQGFKRAILAVALFGLMVAGVAGHAGGAMAATTAETTQSVQCTTALGTYRYYKTQYDNATNSKDKMFYYNLMNQAAFNIGYYC
jgi:hypothetical protein